MVYIEIPKEFDKSVIGLVAKKLQLAPSYIEWLLSVGNKEALQEYNAAQQLRAVDLRQHAPRKNKSVGGASH